ncbi:MAG: hypothetical protein DRP52_00020 [Planctomycetota bacterium]|nr:MAG: hypothetical protein DRP52_00020 [Planctomycetota bacterium]
MNKILIIVLLLVLAPAGQIVAAEKKLSPPYPIEAKHWDRHFAPETCSVVGAYMTMVRQGKDKYAAFVNTWGNLEEGLEMWTGATLIDFNSAGVVLANSKIDDLADEAGKPHPKRCITRPFIDWHRDDGFVGIVHVCRDYMPVDKRVYPALVTSKTGKAGSWKYHGRLKGEIWDEFGDNAEKTTHSDGGAFFFQPEKSAKLNREKPLENRYVFFTSHYSGWGHVNILFSNDGKEWIFYRGEDGKIVNLIPFLAGKGMIFPHIVNLRENGWSMTLSQGWPPVAIWRLWSPDGFNWQFVGEQPEIVVPDDLFIKNLSLWYDSKTALLNGYLTVRSARPDGSIQSNKYHSQTNLFFNKDIKLSLEVQ